MLLLFQRKEEKRKAQIIYCVKINFGAIDDLRTL